MAKKSQAKPVAIRTGSIVVNVKTDHSDGCRYGEALTEMHCGGGQLSATLASLATLFAGTSDEYGGGAHILILRRKP